MNQLEAPTQATRSTTVAAESSASPLPAPSSMLTKAMTKRHDTPEVDHDDDDQARQEQRKDHKHSHDGDVSGNQHGVDASTDDACEPMVKYDGFESVGKEFNTPAFPRFRLADDGDEDVVDVRSPILCRPSSSDARSATLSPTCVSAMVRNDVVKGDGDLAEPSWTIQEFQEYLAMLELLQDACSNSEGEEMCLSAASLGQMERMLTSLLPQGV